MPLPRIAFLPDSSHEVNGVANTARQFAAYAERRGVPMLVVRAALPEQVLPAMPGRSGSVETLDLRRSAAAVPMERDLHFDPLFARYGNTIERALRAFRPDVVHITGPSELGIAGAYYAWRLGIPLAASWHTNVHEYAARRMTGWTRHLGQLGPRVDDAAEEFVLDSTARFYRLARVLYAPNQPLCDLLAERTGRPCFLMQRGVDSSLYAPAHRTRPDVVTGPGADATARPRLGFVGRLSTEKNVALLPRVAAELHARGVAVQWAIIGGGAEEAALRASMPPDTIFAGVLRGAELARAYADLDVFVFPSHTDTFGNVVLEAMASGVPAVVTPDGGPATIVTPGVTGAVATDHDFAAALAEMLTTPGMLAAMKLAAREHALRCSWDTIFDGVLARYPVAVAATEAAAADAAA